MRLEKIYSYVALILADIIFCIPIIYDAMWYDIRFMSKETFDKLLLYYVYNQLFDLHFEIQMTIIKYVIF